MINLIESRAFLAKINKIILVQKLFGVMKELLIGRFLYLAKQISIFTRFKTILATLIYNIKRAYVSLTQWAYTVHVKKNKPNDQDIKGRESSSSWGPARQAVWRAIRRQKAFLESYYRCVFLDQLHSYETFHYTGIQSKNISSKCLLHRKKKHMKNRVIV